MNSINANEGSVWVIKDQEGNFVNNSIYKSDEFSKESYIPSFRTFGASCRCYEDKNEAEVTLIKLNKKKASARIDAAFHLENCILTELIDQYLQFRKTGKDNIVIIENKIPCELRPKVKHVLYSNKIALIIVFILVKALTKTI